MPTSTRTGHDRFYDTPWQICDCPTGGQGRPPLQDVLRFRRTLCNFAIAHRRGERGIDPYGQIALSPFAVRFCGCTLHGRGRTPPLRNRGILRIRIGASEFATPHRTILSSRLRRATSLYTREALVRAVPHWCAETRSAVPRGRGKPRPYVTTKRVTAQK